jgi:hypothetical protein
VAELRQFHSHEHPRTSHDPGGINNPLEFCRSGLSGVQWVVPQSALDRFDDSLHAALGFGLIRLFAFNLYTLLFQVQAQQCEHRYVDVRNPDQGKSADQITPPICVKQFEAGDEEKNYGDVMAKAVFAGEEVEKFALIKTLGILAAGYANLMEFAK